MLKKPLAYSLFSWQSTLASSINSSKCAGVATTRSAILRFFMNCLLRSSLTEIKLQIETRSKTGRTHRPARSGPNERNRIIGPGEDLWVLARALAAVGGQKCGATRL